LSQDKRNLKNKKVLVAGLGRSGIAAARLAAACGARVTVTDIRTESELKDSLARLSPETDIILGKTPESLMEGTELLVLSPGIPPRQPWIQEAIRSGAELIGEVELAFRMMSGRILGITGTNGKTTTTMLTGKILSSAGIDIEIAGNVGTALSDRVLDAQNDNRSPLYVTELSSFQLEGTHTFRCPIAVILNCTPDHLDRYRDFSEYRKTKLRVFLNQEKDDYAVINADSPELVEAAEDLDAQVFPFSTSRVLEKGVFVDQGALWVRQEDESIRLLDIEELKLRGNHNLENAAAALAASFLAGAPPFRMADAVRDFKGLEHRLEFVGCFNGTEFFNDSKSTTPHSTQKALESFPGGIILIMGGFDKGSDFTFLAEEVSAKVRKLILIGDTAAKISSQLTGYAPQRTADTFANAVAEAFKSAQPGNTVLFSPGCSSFDMFRDFEHRGKAFKELVLEMASAIPDIPAERKWA